MFTQLNLVSPLIDNNQYYGCVAPPGGKEESKSSGDALVGNRYAQHSADRFHLLCANGTGRENGLLTLFLRVECILFITKPAVANLHTFTYQQLHCDSPAKT
jgi:hypothetical protein